MEQFDYLILSTVYKFFYLLTYLVLNKQNTDSRTVCNAESTIISAVLNTESSQLTHSAFPNLTFADWFH